MAIHSLNLLENAVDSFNEALKKYDEGNNGARHAYKFAIQHFSQFLELLFKYYVIQSHPLLIYKNPFSKNLQKENTIGLWDAIQFLKNEGKTIDKNFFSDLNWIKNLRNDIEHYKFKMDTKEVRQTLGRLTQALIDFNNQIAQIEIEDHISPVYLKTFKDLADDYQASLVNARTEAKEESETEKTYDCPICGNFGTVAYIEKLYICQYCGNEDSEKNCSICGINFRLSGGYVWKEGSHYLCEGCHEELMNI